MQPQPIRFNTRGESVESVIPGIRQPVHRTLASILAGNDAGITQTALARSHKGDAPAHVIRVENAESKQRETDMQMIPQFSTKKSSYKQKIRYVVTYHFSLAICSVFVHCASKRGGGCIISVSLTNNRKVSGGACLDILGPYPGAPSDRNATGTGG